MRRVLTLGVLSAGVGVVGAAAASAGPLGVGGDLGGLDSFDAGGSDSSSPTAPSAGGLGPHPGHSSGDAFDVSGLPVVPVPPVEVVVPGLLDVDVVRLEPALLEPADSTVGGGAAGLDGLVDGGPFAGDVLLPQQLIDEAQIVGEAVVAAPPVPVPVVPSTVVAGPTPDRPADASANVTGSGEAPRAADGVPRDYAWDPYDPDLVPWWTDPQFVTVAEGAAQLPRHLYFPDTPSGGPVRGPEVNPGELERFSQQAGRPVDQYRPATGLGDRAQLLEWLYLANKDLFPAALGKTRDELQRALGQARSGVWSGTADFSGVSPEAFNAAVAQMQAHRSTPRPDPAAVRNVTEALQCLAESTGELTAENSVRLTVACELSAALELDAVTIAQHNLPTSRLRTGDDPSLAGNVRLLRLLCGDTPTANVMCAPLDPGVTGLNGAPTGYVPDGVLPPGLSDVVGDPSDRLDRIIGGVCTPFDILGLEETIQEVNTMVTCAQEEQGMAVPNELPNAEQRRQSREEATTARGTAMVAARTDPVSPDAAAAYERYVAAVLRLREAMGIAPGANGLIVPDPTGEEVPPVGDPGAPRLMAEYVPGKELARLFGVPYGEGFMEVVTYRSTPAAPVPGSVAAASVHRARSDRHGADEDASDGGAPPDPPGDEVPSDSTGSTGSTGPVGPGGFVVRRDRPLPGTGFDPNAASRSRAPKQVPVDSPGAGDRYVPDPLGGFLLDPELTTSELRSPPWSRPDGSATVFAFPPVRPGDGPGFGFEPPGAGGTVPEVSGERGSGGGSTLAVVGDGSMQPPPGWPVRVPRQPTVEQSSVVRQVLGRVGEFVGGPVFIGRTADGGFVARWLDVTGGVRVTGGSYSAAGSRLDGDGPAVIPGWVLATVGPSAGEVLGVVGKVVEVASLPARYLGETVFRRYAGSR